MGGEAASEVQTKPRMSGGEIIDAVLPISANHDGTPQPFNYALWNPHKIRRGQGYNVYFFRWYRTKGGRIECRIRSRKGNLRTLCNRLRYPFVHGHLRSLKRYIWARWFRMLKQDD